MKRVHYLISAALFPALLSITAYSENDGDTISRTAILADPCAVALAPHSGSDTVDQTIIRLQEKSRQAINPPISLERLGWAFVAKARASFDTGYYRLAEQTALCMASKQADSDAALLLRGHVLHNLHRFGEAETLARKLIDRRGLWFDYALLGDALMEQGKLDVAIVAYQQMLDQKPGPVAYMRAAHMRWLKGDLTGAIELMQMARRAISGRDAELSAWINTRLALYEMQAGRLSHASRYLDRTLEQHPDYAPALLGRGRLLLAGAQYREAIVPLTRAVALSPLPETRWTLIEALRAAGDEVQAQQAATRLGERGAIDDARTYALYLATTGHKSELALKLVHDEYQNRTDVFTLDAYAWALMARGRTEKAHEFMVRALAHGTADARLFLHAGVIARALGHTDEAARWLAKAVAIKQMLLPSERTRLDQEFAVLKPQISPLAWHQTLDQ